MINEENVVIEQFIRFCTEMEIVTEAEVIDESSGCHYLIRLMAHLLKYMIQPEKQTASWIVSIVDSRFKLEGSSNSIKNLLRERIDSLYKQAIKSVSKDTKFNKKLIPNEMMWDWTLENLLDKQWIAEFLQTYAYSNDAVDYISHDKFLKLNHLD